MDKVIYLVDASTFIHRSYHAIRGLATGDGRPTNAIYGFVATLNKLLRDKQPEYLLVAYDAKGPSFRVDMYPDYKANRPPMPEDLISQQEPIRQIVRAMGLHSLEVTGLEADDIIATSASRAVEAGYQVVIVSSDKDYYQLLSDKVSMYDPNPKKESAMSVDSLWEKYELRPDQFLEAQGLMGDSTDNIPGVPGVGEKTAVKLIQEYGDIDGVYRNLEKIKQAKMREKLTANKDAALLSLELARLKTEADLDLDWDGIRVGPADRESLLTLYKDLEFNRFSAELESAHEISYDDYHLVATPDELKSLVEEMESAQRLSLDLETTSLDPHRAEIVGISMASQAQRAFYIPVGHQTIGAVQLDWETVRSQLGPILESDRIGKIGQNIKYDYTILRHHGLEVRPIVGDSMMASYLLNPGAGGHGLDNLAREYLGHDTIKYEDVVGNTKTGFERVTPEAARDYACEDADVALMLEGLLREKLEETELVRVYEDLEVPLIAVLAEMEMNGVLLDTDLLREISKELSSDMARAEDRIYQLAGRKFNINSPKQLGQILFEDLGLPQGKKTKKKTGYSTDVDVLTELALVHDLPSEILNYRSLKKLQSTYVDALVQLINPRTGRVHTSFNQAVTATGRLSSSDPNLQNIPVRTPEGRRIREAFVAPPGHRILSADYSQIELRVLAHYSQDPGLIDAFLAGDDVHTRTAAEVFAVMPGLVTPEMRREAKAINFGIVYGLQAFGLSRQLGIEKKVAQNYIDSYFKQYAGVKRYIDETTESAKKAGYVTTLLGRRRGLPEINSRNYQARSMAERMAINTPIQGTAADLIKLAMLAVYRTIKQSGLGAKMILQVHDELVFDVPEEELEQTAALVRREMEGVYTLAVPLLVDMSHGANWAEAH